MYIGSVKDAFREHIGCVEGANSVNSDSAGCIKGEFRFHLSLKGALRGRLRYTYGARMVRLKCV